jgi:hypothetical protein
MFTGNIGATYTTDPRAIAPLYATIQSPIYERYSSPSYFRRRIQAPYGVGRAYHYVKVQSSHSSPMFSRVVYTLHVDGIRYEEATGMYATGRSPYVYCFCELRNATEIPPRIKSSPNAVPNITKLKTKSVSIHSATMLATIFIACFFMRSRMVGTVIPNFLFSCLPFLPFLHSLIVANVGGDPPELEATMKH